MRVHLHIRLLVGQPSVGIYFIPLTLERGWC